MIRAGTMRHLIAIHRDTGSADAGGTIVPSFASIAAPNADVETLTGDESQQAGKTEAKAKVRFTMAYYSGLTTKDRIVWDGRTFGITSIDDVDGMNVKHIVETVEVK